MIEFNGEEVQIQQLSKRYNVPWNTIYNRYKRGIRGDALVSKTPCHISDIKRGERWPEIIVCLPDATEE